MKINLLPRKVVIDISKFDKETNGVWISMPDMNYDEFKDDPYVCTCGEAWAGRVLGLRDEEYAKLTFNEKKYIADHPEVDCVIDYPLSRPCKFKIKFNKWITPLDVIDQICKKYQEIYKEEDKTAIMEIRSENTPCLNRSRTDGKWGIWGHSIEDLVIERLYLDTDKNKIDMFIGS